MKTTSTKTAPPRIFTKEDWECYSGCESSEPYIFEVTQQGDSEEEAHEKIVLDISVVWDGTQIEIHCISETRAWMNGLESESYHSEYASYAVASAVFDALFQRFEMGHSLEQIVTDFAFTAI